MKSSASLKSDTTCSSLIHIANRSGDLHMSEAFETCAFETFAKLLQPDPHRQT